MAEVPSQFVRRPSFFHIEAQEDLGLAFTDIERAEPTLHELASEAVHNCIVHPIVGSMYLVGDLLRILSPRTAAAGRRVTSFGEAIHELF